jgi:hypothetical protein
VSVPVLYSGRISSPKLAAHNNPLRAPQVLAFNATNFKYIPYTRNPVVPHTVRPRGYDCPSLQYTPHNPVVPHTVRPRGYDCPNLQYTPYNPAVPHTVRPRGYDCPSFSNIYMAARPTAGQENRVCSLATTHQRGSAQMNEIKHS